MLFDATSPITAVIATSDPTYAGVKVRFSVWHLSVAVCVPATSAYVFMPPSLHCPFTAHACSAGFLLDLWFHDVLGGNLAVGARQHDWRRGLVPPHPLRPGD